MPDAYELFAKLDRCLRDVRLGHEAIWQLHGDLVVRGRADDYSRAGLARSARIAAVDVPNVVREAQRLRARWFEQDLLDPPAAATTLASLQAEVERIQPQLDFLMASQRRVAAALRRVLDNER